MIEARARLPFLKATAPGCWFGILFYEAWNMSDAHRFAIVLKTAPRADVGILVMTFLLAVFSGLVGAVNVGVVLDSLLFMRRMSKAVSIEEHSQE